LPSISPTHLLFGGQTNEVALIERKLDHKVAISQGRNFKQIYFNSATFRVLMCKTEGFM
jgi:hypothetical protein